MDDINNEIIDLNISKFKDPSILNILIILNYPIEPELLLEVKSISNIIICADGCSNRLYDNDTLKMY